MAALIIVLLVLIVLGLPTWPFAYPGWGYYPSSGLGLILVILLLALALGHRF